MLSTMSVAACAGPRPSRPWWSLVMTPFAAWCPGCTHYRRIRTPACGLRGQDRVDLPHRRLHAFLHAHGEQLLESLERGKGRHRHHARAALVRLEGEPHVHRRHAWRRPAVGPEEAVCHLEGTGGVDAQELPEAARLLAVRPGHHVLGASADGKVVPLERRRPFRRAPEALDLARVSVGGPHALDGSGKLRGDGHRELPGVLADVYDRHAVLLGASW